MANDKEVETTSEQDVPQEPEQAPVPVNTSQTDQAPTASAKQADERVESPEISFEDYALANPINPGLIASFSYETKASGRVLEELHMTSEEWSEALETQKERQYI